MSPGCLERYRGNLLIPRVVLGAGRDGPWWQAHWNGCLRLGGVTRWWGLVLKLQVSGSPRVTDTGTLVCTQLPRKIGIPPASVGWGISRSGILRGSSGDGRAAHCAHRSGPTVSAPLLPGDTRPSVSAGPSFVAGRALRVNTVLLSASATLSLLASSFLSYSGIFHTSQGKDAVHIDTGKRVFYCFLIKRSMNLEEA